MKLKTGFVLREVGGRAIVIALDPTLCLDGMLSLNESARYLWDMLTVGASREELILGLMTEYGIDKALAERDTDSLLSTIKELSLLDTAEA